MNARQGPWRATCRAFTLAAWVLVLLLFGASAASWAAPIPPLPESGGIASRWVCTHHDPVAADPGPPAVDAELGYSGCAVTEWEPLPVPDEPPAPAAGPDAEAINATIEAESARNRVVGILGVGLVVFVTTAAFFRSGGR